MTGLIGCECGNGVSLSEGIVSTCAECGKQYAYDRRGDIIPWQGPRSGPRSTTASSPKAKLAPWYTRLFAFVLGAHRP